MEPHKFEEEFKSKLQNREIEPSPKSWEQLRAKLDKEDKKPISMYWWMSIAASFVAGILIVNLVFNSSEETGSPMLVEETHKNLEVEKQQNPIPQTIIESQLTEVSEEEEETQIASSEIKVHYTKSTISEEENSIAESLPKEKKHESNIVKEEDFLPKLNEIIAVTAANNNEEPIFEDEVEILLRGAAEQLYQEKKYEKRLSAIHANSLLQSVEMELNQTFREKIFEMLKEGYLKTKNAVAIKTN